MFRRSAAVVAAVTLAVTFTACGDDDDDGDDATTTEAAAPDGTEAAAPDATDAPAAGDATIVIAEFSFGDPLTVPAGTTVTVMNNDTAPHTLTADDGSFDTGEIEVAGTAEITLDEPGTYTFHCNIHTSMTGSITVEG